MNSGYGISVADDSVYVTRTEKKLDARNTTGRIKSTIICLLSTRISSVIIAANARINRAVPDASADWHSTATTGHITAGNPMVRTGFFRNGTQRIHL